MTKPNDGGPAYPVAGYINEHGNEQPGEYGMSLRDWFAGQALAGFSANQECYGWKFEQAADYAYQQADAMLAERYKDDTNKEATHDH